MTPHEALEKHFGFREFLQAQEEIVRAVQEGRDALVIMPTGGGKSLCYQLPALLKPGITFVVSPLIALMKDQVDALQAKSIPATLINSTLSWAEQSERVQRLREGAYRLVYVAPERFRNERFMEAMEGVTISLVAIDEAHCLSQWGHDFRPDYMRLGAAIERLGRPQTMALTATATPEVREDILNQLKLRDPFTCVSGFERPNLSLRVIQTGSKRQKITRIRKCIKEHGTGIVYCATRRHVSEIAETFQDEGMEITAYHGGLKDDERERAQNDFLSGKTNVVVATNAFGMGIDRADVRFVVHFDVPGSIEAYYQEAGRAGRDGEPAVCELLFNMADTRTQEFFIEGANPDRATITSVYSMIQQMVDANHEVQIPIQDLADRLAIRNTMSVSSSLATLGRHGYLQRFDIPGKLLRGTRLRHPEIDASKLEIDWAALREKERRDRDKLKRIIEFSYSPKCRQQAILDYFGEKGGYICGTCDNCSGRRGEVRMPTDEEKDMVRKALSGVARMSRRRNGEWVARFGRGKIIQMLLGGRSQEVLNARLDTLSTYGLLADVGSAYLHALFREMQEAGFLQVQKTPYPLVTLTAIGEDVMRDTMVWKLCWPSDRLLGKTGGASKTPQPEPPEDEIDVELFESMKETRTKLAQRDSVPPYVVFSDRTLKYLAASKPETVEEALELPGIGPKKAETYLMSFLMLIRGGGGEVE